MKAVIFEKFGAPLKVSSMPDPIPEAESVIVKVEASGICRSDWHGWMGSDPDIINLPHIPGHELAGIIKEVGKDVKNWKRGSRVTVPFVGGCGKCPECTSGNHQVCDNQFQPGFTHWGSFAEYVEIKYADINLISLPDDMDFVISASLGCRFSTSYRAVVTQGAVKPDQWVVVFGCGGVGLSTIMIAKAFGTKVIAVDIKDTALNIAKSVGATITLNSSTEKDVVNSIMDITGRGAHVSFDALGSEITCSNSIRCLRKRGRHVQVGLLVGADYRPRIPMEYIVAKELEIFGSHGIQASKYPEIFKMIRSKKINPELIIGKTIPLDMAPLELEKMGQFADDGITVIDRF